jgi:hypothetical protein
MRQVPPPQTGRWLLGRLPQSHSQLNMSPCRLLHLNARNLSSPVNLPQLCRFVHEDMNIRFQ